MVDNSKLAQIYFVLKIPTGFLVKQEKFWQRENSKDKKEKGVLGGQGWNPNQGFRRRPNVHHIPNQVYSFHTLCCEIRTVVVLS